MPDPVPPAPPAPAPPEGVILPSFDMSGGGAGGVTPPTPEPPAPGDPTPDEAAALGDPGKRAIDRMKQERDEALRRAREAEEAVEAARLASLDEHQRAVEEARAAGRDEALTSAREKMFVAHLQAATTGKLADPSDLADPTVALRLLGLDEIPVTTEGDIDAESISAAVASLLDRKPHLAVSATPPAGGADQGARPAPPTKDLDAQIAEAEAKGDWSTSRRLKQHKLAALPRP